VTDVDPKDAVAVYPTATEDYVTVVVPLKADQITMHDMSGKLIVNVKAKDTQMIDMRSLPKGVYLINIKTESGNVTKKVIRK
jgi:formylmethanofuran dehydrogenase subunit D